MVSFCLVKNIQTLREEMGTIAQKYHFNFLNPEVIRISQQLDILINKAMKNEYICIEKTGVCICKLKNERNAN